MFELRKFSKEINEDKLSRKLMEVPICDRSKLNLHVLNTVIYKRNLLLKILLCRIISKIVSKNYKSLYQLILEHVALIFKQQKYFLNKNIQFFSEVIFILIC